ncbi:SAM-dependent methyltransferase [Kutzneria sp. CA-103260]|uniref:SAM-dependent methyltransferase n=1 Tax=Kutzneria sp. CA-103260 TaxID=2802641 RepID=UPI001BADACFC|nr:SAM-dependent methyltransferase [Kutzneria sp. CA-103260]QUQ64419.1 SAM-dependent methyltransferase [Kutzneria sp. CA-103260]
MTDSEQDPFPPQGVDLDHPSVARVYDWYLGGNANWAIDREFGERVLTTFPLLRPIAIANRLFLHRVVRHLVRQGVRQFVDIGSGVPTMGNTHQVADEVAPDSRVVYIDHEPVAVAHSQVLLEQNGDPARHASINADLRNPDRLWQRVIETGVIDLDEPIALLVIAVLHVQQPDGDGVDVGQRAIARYRELLPSGSYLAISHITDDGVPEDVAGKLVELKRMYDTSSSPVIWRSRDQIRELFGGFELVSPGMGWTSSWHPEETGPTSPVIEFDRPNEAVIWAGVGRKP